MLRTDQIYQKALNKQRQTSGEPTIEDFEAEDLNERINFNQLLEAIQYVNVEPSATLQPPESQERLEEEAHERVTTAEVLSARNHERPSAVANGSVTSPSGRSDYGRTRASLGANVLVDDPFSKTKRNFMDDLQTQRKRLHYPLAMTKTSSDFGKLMVPASSFA